VLQKKTREIDCIHKPNSIGFHALILCYANAYRVAVKFGTIHKTNSIGFHALTLCYANALEFAFRRNFVVKSIGVNCYGTEKCLFIPILYSNVIAAWMAWEYWKMHANDSSCIADKALIPRNAFHSNAALGLRPQAALIGMHYSGFVLCRQCSSRHSRAFSNTPAPSMQHYGITILRSEFHYIRKDGCNFQYIHTSKNS